MIDLFQRNFDVDMHREPNLGSAVADAEKQLKLQLEEARQQGFDAGRRIGRKEAQETLEAAQIKMQADMRSQILEKVAELTAADALHAQTMERQIVDLFLGIAERLFPELLEAYGTELAIMRIKQSIQLSRTDPATVIRACPDVVGMLKSEVPQRQNAMKPKTEIDLQPDPTMNPTAVQVYWQGGKLDYDLQAACRTVQNALAQAAEELEKSTREAG